MLAVAGWHVLSFHVVVAGQCGGRNIRGSAHLCLPLCWGKENTLSVVASFSEEISLSEYFPFGPILKCKMGSIPLNYTLCGRLTTFSFPNISRYFSLRYQVGAR